MPACCVPEEGRRAPSSLVFVRIGALLSTHPLAGCAPELLSTETALAELGRTAPSSRPVGEDPFNLTRFNGLLVKLKRNSGRA